MLLEIPITAKIMPLLLAGWLTVATPIPDIVYQPGDGANYTEIGYNLDNDRCLFVYTDKNGEYDGWQSVNIQDKNQTRFWFKEEQTTDQPLADEQAIINIYNMASVNSTTIKKKGFTTAINRDGELVEMPYEETTVIEHGKARRFHKSGLIGKTWTFGKSIISKVYWWVVK